MLKKYVTLLALFGVICIESQTKKPDHLTQKIANSERSSTSRTMNLQINPNTQNYDVTYHKLEFSVNPANYFIAGIVTTTYTALANISTVTFDLSNNLTVSTVKKNGSPLSFSRSTNNELIVNLPATQISGTAATLEITYSGAPPRNGFNAFTTDTRSSGAKSLYTLSEPFGARDWWPCKQDLNDKINAIDVYITAPSQYVAVSNGIETSPPVISGTNKTTHFHHNYPIAAYLICMAVTNYMVYNQTGGTAPNTYPIINYIYPEDFTAVQSKLDQTPLILNLYENLFEIYPFHNEKYGHAEFGWGGGMEHTTVSFMVGFDRQLIAHEMAHQWFGDKVTCGSWKDIWLNEGFATYLSALVIENFDGNAAFIDEKANMINYIISQTNGAVYLTDAEALDDNRIFDSRLSYEKGAMVLNMLRFKMGDALFFQGIKSYLSDSTLAYNYAHTNDLQTHLETAYGQSLTEFFNDWVYKQGYPTYEITATNLSAGTASITINQTQSDPSVSFFEMPVPIRLYDSGGNAFDVVLDNTVNGQQFVVNVPFVVSDVFFNPNNDIVAGSSSAILDTTASMVDKLIGLYPNPASDIINIKLPNNFGMQQIVFYNSLGQKVLSENNKTINVSGLAKGIYEVKILTDNGNFHKKFIKK